MSRDAEAPSASAPLSQALPTVLVVDDAPANLSLLASLLNRHYRVRLAASGAKALELAQRTAPDLILLDVMMPEMDGYEVCRRLKADARTCSIPVLFLTAMSQPEDEARGFEVGGADFIHKPISPTIVHARVRTHLQIKAYQDELADRNAWLENELGKRLGQVDQLREATLHVMVSFAEFRDEDTPSTSLSRDATATCSPQRASPTSPARRPCTTLAKSRFLTTSCSNRVATHPRRA